MRRAMWLLVFGVGCGDVAPGEPVDPGVSFDKLVIEAAAPAEGDLGAAPASAPDCTLEVDGAWPAAWTACQTDADCTEAPTSWCPCEAGGSFAAVAVHYAACVPRPPTLQMCLDVYTCDDDGPLCEAGVCVRD